MAPHANDPTTFTPSSPSAGPLTNMPTANGHATDRPLNGHSHGFVNGRSNGFSRKRTSPRSHLLRHDSHEPYDLICVGFGPANLALAIAMNDALDTRTPLPGLSRFSDPARPPRVLFLEKQGSFGWHKGMLLPGAKMQISFLKDLATLRDPRSAFTFINYLHSNRRLVQFSNLDTFLPLRKEYHDYMSWCASSFEDVVEYGQEVAQIRPVNGRSGRVATWEIESRNVVSGNTEARRARHVVVAVGGSPKIPAPFPAKSARVLHSSQYLTSIEGILPDMLADYRIAVVGSGQSAAEIFNDLHSRYPNSQTRMLVKHRALKPSDDSPFVNEVFDPERVEEFYSKDAETRAANILEDRSTNYGVVRLGLLERLYETLYHQRLEDEDEEHWPHRILPQTSVVDAQATHDGVALMTRCVENKREERMEVDAVIVAAGYGRDMHEWMLQSARGLMPGGDADGQRWTVGRDYGVIFEKNSLEKDCGVWLSGCNESTHGLSDTLLSILSVRGGEMLHSMFGDR